MNRCYTWMRSFSPAKHRFSRTMTPCPLGHPDLNGETDTYNNKKGVASSRAPAQSSFIGFADRAFYDSHFSLNIVRSYLTQRRNMTRSSVSRCFTPPFCDLVSGVTHEPTRLRSGEAWRCLSADKEHLIRSQSRFLTTGLPSCPFVRLSKSCFAGALLAI